MCFVKSILLQLWESNGKLSEKGTGNGALSREGTGSGALGREGTGSGALGGGSGVLGEGSGVLGRECTGSGALGGGSGALCRGGHGQRSTRWGQWSARRGGHEESQMGD